MTACEGAVGAAGKPGDAGKDGVVGGDKLTLGTDGYWYINGQKTDIKVEGVAELELTQAEGTTKKVNYLANDTLNLDGFGVKVNYTEYNRLVEDYILVWDDKISGQEKIIGRYGAAYKKTDNPDYPTIPAPGGGEKDYSRNFNTLATSEEGEQTILVYGPAAEPASFKINVIVFEFESIPTLTRTQALAANTGSFGDQLTATFVVKYADKIKNDDLKDFNDDSSFTFQFYNNGRPYTAQSISTSGAGTIVTTPANTSSQRTYTVVVNAYAGPGPYSFGVKTLGFKEAKNLPTDNQNGFTTTFNLDPGHSSDGVNKFNKFMEQSDFATYSVNLVYTDSGASFAAISDIRDGLLKGNPTAARAQGLRINLDLTGVTGNTTTPTIISTGNSAFEGCEALIALTFNGNYVKNVGTKVFNQCPNLERITVRKNVVGVQIQLPIADGDLVSEGGVLYKATTVDDDPDYEGDGTAPLIAVDKTLICWPAKKELPTSGLIVIDEYVTSVLGFAITHNTALRSLDIYGTEDDLTVAADAVIYCPALNKVTIRQPGEAGEVTYAVGGPFSWYGDLNSVFMNGALGRAGVFTGRAMANSDNCTIWSWAALP
jgi:hypothetical protein